MTSTKFHWWVEDHVRVTDQEIKSLKTEEELISFLNVAAYYMADRIKQCLIEKGLWKDAGQEEQQEVQEEPEGEIRSDA